MRPRSRRRVAFASALSSAAGWRAGNPRGLRFNRVSFRGLSGGVQRKEAGRRKIAALVVGVRLERPGVVVSQSSTRSPPLPRGRIEGRGADFRLLATKEATAHAP